MIDLTKELSVKINKDFLDNVLNKKDFSDVKDYEDLQNLPLEDLEALLDQLKDDPEMDSASEFLPGFDQPSRPNIPEIRPAVEDDSLFKSIHGFQNGWWVKKDRTGKPIKPDFEKDDFFRNVIVAPLYLLKFTYLSIQKRSSDKNHDLVAYFKSLEKLSMLTGAFSLVSWLILDLVFLMKMSSLFFLSVLLFLVSKGYGLYFFNKYGDLVKEQEEPLLDLDEEIDLSELDHFDEDFLATLKPDQEVDEFDWDDEDDTEDSEVYDMPSDEKTQNYKDNFPFPLKYVSPDTTVDAFNKMLLDAYRKSARFRLGYTPVDRKWIVESFQEYMFCNNPNFADTTPISKSSVTYKNIAYLIYDGLTIIKPALNYSGDYTMQVSNLTETTLFYRIEFRITGIPLKLSDIMSGLSDIKALFKIDSEDSDVSIQVSTYAKNFVFRIMKSGDPLISWGDLIRHYNPKTGKGVYDQFLDPKMVLPVLIGLENMETPYVYDVINNTSMVISGQSGSGKSFGTYSWLFNIMIQSHPGDVNFMIFDYKGDPQYSALGLLPHVLGVYRDTSQYLDLMKEALLELDRRKQIMDALKVSKWQDVREKLKDKPDELRKLPYMFIIVEEMKATLSDLTDLSKKDEYMREFVSLMVKLAKQGRSLGMRLIAISQRPLNDEIPRSLLSECATKWGFKLMDKDIEILQMESKDVLPPDKRGLSLFVSEGNPVKNIRSMAIGHVKDTQILNLTRMIAFEWHSRITDSEAVPEVVSFTLADRRAATRSSVLELIENEDFFTKDIGDLNIGDVLSQVNQNIFKGSPQESSPQSAPHPEIKRPTIRPTESVIDVVNHIPQKRSEIPNGDYTRPSIQNIHPKEDVAMELQKEFGNVTPEEDERVRKRRELAEALRNRNDSQKEPKEVVQSEMVKIQKIMETKVEKDIELQTKIELRNQSPRQEQSINQDLPSDLFWINARGERKKKKISDYILEHGDGVDGKLVEKSIIEKYFTKEEIRDALSNVEILDDGKYYMA